MAVGHSIVPFGRVGYPKLNGGCLTKAMLKGKKAILTLYFKLYIVRGLCANILFSTDIMAYH
jgi:hypothetical protein